MDILGLRKITALNGFDKLLKNPGPPPQILSIPLANLVVNEDYQRELSVSSIKQIKYVAEHWDWSSYKVINVNTTEFPDVYEIVDGQHTAIAAATNGHITELICLVNHQTTLEDKAKSFLGINKNRLTLTRASIHVAELAAQEDVAIKLECALSNCGCKLLIVPPPRNDFKPADTMAIGTIRSIIIKRGQDRIERILTILAKSKAAPISATQIKAVDLTLPKEPDPKLDDRLISIIEGNGAGRIELIAKMQTQVGSRVYETLSDMFSERLKLPKKRQGGYFK